ncbi:hypothetical protein ASPACDRAFT_42528 [Aspergillus aculeatus ATCC 16872]|uniref:Uncharacterized protein n=1 Tax=Aspergillus aculeatus (strain ATCC 16872 / CBS 172.66 / WB 5094) TaxID=690307 RepID=A0A1L9WY28_ASPA1|nr:uncharacterized protein ASPACDRAFT_42528 [Aspergillus aculeatus ATCC 16872]OJK01029.1 hypothetical protein ASPACDRAFT_42528 [Aspergillus aculeatus ATCC 16872]
MKSAVMRPRRSISTIKKWRGPKRIGASKLFATRGSIFVTDTKEAAVHAAETGAIIARNYNGVEYKSTATTFGKLAKAICQGVIVPEDVGTIILDGGDTPLLDTGTNSQVERLCEFLGDDLTVVRSKMPDEVRLTNHQQHDHFSS